MPIYFYSPLEEPYGCFSNFSPHGVDLDLFTQCLDQSGNPKCPGLVQGRTEIGAVAHQ